MRAIFLNRSALWVNASDTVVVMVRSRRLLWQGRVSLVSLFGLRAECSSSLDGVLYLSGNLGGTVFPLFTHQMYRALTYKWANFLFACIAILLMPIPFVSIECIYAFFGLLNSTFF